MSRIRAAVIGLGNIGFKFGLDPLRKKTWSHVDAYMRNRKTELVGAVEIDEEMSDLFKRRYKGIPVFRTVEELMEKAPADIVSICTPTASHRDILKKVAEHKIRAVFCEKPIAASLEEARDMVNLCKCRNIALAVNHNRRWDSKHLFARDIIRSGKIGGVTAVNAIYPGKIFNIGTHLFDTVRLLIDKDAETVSAFSRNMREIDPDVSGWIRFNEGIPCTIVSSGKREDLIFEIDIIGDNGRIRMTENGDKMVLALFKKSRRYSGYRELLPAAAKLPKGNDSFVDAVEDMVSVVRGDKATPNCSGGDGLEALSLCIAMRDSALKGGAPVRVKR